MRFRGLVGVLVLGSVIGSALGAEESPLLRAKFWIDLEPVSAAGDPWPLSAEEAARRLVEEAAWVYAGMVWGFEFEYAPLDRTRGIEELFRLTSLGAISWGDSRLIPGRLESRDPRFLDRTELVAFVDYRPAPADASLLETYARAPWVPAQGIGKADLIRGWPGRREAYEDALREAVRAHLRQIEPNKPRRASGRVVFERAPTIMVAEGFYKVQARARVEVLSIDPYVLY